MKKLIEQKTKQAAEALAAWKSVLKETFDANGKDGLDEKTWTGQQREKQEKAKADFAKLNNEVLALQAKLKEEEELASFEKFYTEPATRLPVHDPAHAELQTSAPSETQMAMEYRATVDPAAAKPSYSYALSRSLTALERQAHREASVAYIKHGSGAAVDRLKLAGFGPSEIHLLSGASGELGGFSFSDDFRNEVVRPRPGFAVVRAAARVMTTSSDVLVMPRVVSGTDPYSSGVSGAWRASGYVSGGSAPTVQDQPTLAQERIQVGWWQPNAIELDPSLLDDNAINLESVIGEELGRTKGLDEDSAFINGDGQGQPLGLTNAGITSVALDSGAVSHATLINLIYGLPSQYRASARHLMRSATFGEYMKLETAAGVNLIFPNFTTQSSATSTPAVANLMGYPVMFSEFMSAVAVSTLVQVFGDFFYYVIAERKALALQRLVERYAPNVGILASARIGGQVVLTDAFRVGTTAA